MVKTFLKASSKKPTRLRQSSGDRIFDAIVLILAIIVFLFCAYPLYFVLIASISNPNLVSAGKVLLIPKEITFEAYQYILRTHTIWTGYGNTLIYTLGTIALGLFITIPAGYALSRKDLVGNKLFMILITFTMFFQGGLIPTYIVINKLGLLNTRIILILLSSVTVFNVIMTRTFFKSNIPLDLFEAASVDGCSNTRFFFSIILPLSKTIIAIIALYVAVAQWNSYFHALIYITESKKYPLQIFLRQILVMGQNLGDTSEMSSQEIEYLQRISLLVKYGIIVVSSAPIIALYPFLQRYFVKGVMIGSIKG